MSGSRVTPLGAAALLASGALACSTPARGGAAPGAAPPSTEPSTTTPDTCPPNALLCEGFEDDAAGQPPGDPWRDATGPSGATVRVDTTRAFGGRQAVHVLAPKGASYRRGYFAVHGAPVFPAASQGMYGRVMVWLDTAPLPLPGQHDVHWTFIQGEGRAASDTHNALYRYGGQHQGGLGLMANYETTPPVKSDCWQHSARTLPVERWACAEWQFDRAKNEMRFWLDGEELTDLHVVERGAGPESGCLHHEHLGGQWLAPPAFQSLYLGFERYQEPTLDQNVWMDDIVVSTERVGCPSRD